ncbi:MAG: DMT family transporter [Candidatus Helarchaeota archaeon]
MSKRNAILYLVASALIWGTSFPFTRFALLFYDFFSFLFLRNIFAMMSTASLFLVMNRHDLKSQLIYLKNPHVILLGVVTVFAMIFQFWGQSLTLAGKSALLINTNIIWTAIISAFWFKERLTKRGLLGMIAGLMGVYFLTIGFRFFMLFEAITIISFFGDLLCLISGIFWAGYIVLSKKIVSLKEEGKHSVDTSSLVFFSTLYMFIILLIPSLFFVRFYNPFISVSLNVLIYWDAFYLGIFCSCIAYVFYFRSLRDISATISSVYLLIEVLGAYIIEFFIFLQIPLFDSFIGGGLICLALVLISVKEQKENIEGKTMEIKNGVLIT